VLLPRSSEPAYSRLRTAERRAIQAFRTITSSVHSMASRCRIFLAVNKTGLVVEKASGGFTYLTAGIDAMGQEVASAVDQVRQPLRQQYGEWTTPLPVVAITDGAKSIRCDLETIFGRAVPLILDWYHLEKKVWELMSMIARKKVEKEQHVQHLLTQLWQGHTEAALEYLRTAVVTNRAEKLEALCTYLEKHQNDLQQAIISNHSSCIAQKMPRTSR
jgi:DNA-binding Xre family transcriptional regulator